MGTSTIFIRMNDLGLKFEYMSKKDLKELGKLFPFSKDNWYKGWKAAFELHNGNIYPLIFWKGRLMRLKDAPKELSRKYWDKYTGKTRKEYEWTLLKNFLLNQIEYLDEEFKKEIRKRNRKKRLKKTK